jgi:hypothetical protein
MLTNALGERRVSATREVFEVFASKIELEHDPVRSAILATPVRKK